jgi:hypothetical protein
MASKTTNRAIEALERRHAAERAALRAATDATAVVGRAQERRAAEVERLDAMVAEAEQGANLALAVLASLVTSDVAAVLTGETPARVRQGQQRASVEDVTARVGELTDGVAVARRRGRPSGSAAPARRESGDRPSAGAVVARGSAAAGPAAVLGGAPSSEGR